MNALTVPQCIRRRATDPSHYASFTYSSFSMFWTGRYVLHNTYGHRQAHEINDLNSSSFHAAHTFVAPLHISKENPGAMNHDDYHRQLVTDKLPGDFVPQCLSLLSPTNTEQQLNTNRRRSTRTHFGCLVRLDAKMSCEHTSSVDKGTDTSLHPRLLSDDPRRTSVRKRRNPATAILQEAHG